MVELLNSVICVFWGTLTEIKHLISPKALHITQPFGVLMGVFLGVPMSKGNAGSNFDLRQMR